MKLHSRTSQVSTYPSPHKKDIILAVKQIDTNLREPLVVKSRSLAALRPSPKKNTDYDELALPSSPISPVSPTLPELAMNGASLFGSSPNAPSSPTPVNNLLTPIQNGATRRVNSNDYSKRSTSTSNGQHATNGEVQNVPPGTSPLSASAEQAQWSSGIGHATTGGKSGRVIERLMSENDRLKRDLKEHVNKVEELQRNIQNYKPRIDSLQEANDLLTHNDGVKETNIRRRDRQIADLKEELALQKDRNRKLEVLTQNLSTERDSVIYEKEREVGAEQEKARFFENQYNILKTSYSHMSQTYKNRQSNQVTRIDNHIEPQLKTLKKDRDHDEAVMGKLNIVHNQLNQAIVRTNTVHEEMVDKNKDAEALREQRLQEIKAETDEKNEETERLNSEMQDTVNKMRWVMKLQQSREEGSQGKEERKDSHK